MPKVALRLYYSAHSLHYDMEENHQYNFKLSAWRKIAMEEEGNNAYLCYPGGYTTWVVSRNLGTVLPKR